MVVQAYLHEAVHSCFRQYMNPNAGGVDEHWRSSGWPMHNPKEKELVKLVFPDDGDTIDRLVISRELSGVWG
jgi:hypothetical protein